MPPLVPMSPSTAVAPSATITLGEPARAARVGTACSRHLVGLRLAVVGRAALDDVADVDFVARNPIAAIIRRAAAPPCRRTARPARPRPRPGPSPMKQSSAAGLPRANTVCVRSACSPQRVQPRTSSASSARRSLRCSVARGDCGGRSAVLALASLALARGARCRSVPAYSARRSRPERLDRPLAALPPARHPGRSRSQSPLAARAQRLARARASSSSLAFVNAPPRRRVTARPRAPPCSRCPPRSPPGGTPSPARRRGEHAGHAGLRRARLRLDVAVRVELELADEELGHRRVADGDEQRRDGDRRFSPRLHVLRPRRRSRDPRRRRARRRPRGCRGSRSSGSRRTRSCIVFDARNSSRRWIERHVASRGRRGSSPLPSRCRRRRRPPRARRGRARRRTRRRR